MPVEDPKKSNSINVETIEKGIDVETGKPCAKLKDTRSETKMKNDFVKKDNAIEELMKCKECEYET